MFAQTLAFLTRSIRQESRLLTHHVVRGSLVLLTLFLFFSQVIEAPRRGASGLYLVSSISNCCYYCLTLLGVMYFSVAITEEKEEETLPLLRMTGISNFTLLTGKSLPRLVVVALLILVSTPFLVLSITLGGVLPEQILALILGMMCYAFFLSQLGLFCSTVCRSGNRAVTLTFVLWLVFEFGGWLLYAMAYGCQLRDFFLLQDRFEKASSYLLERSMWNACSEYLMFERGESIRHDQMTFHMAIGQRFFLISWLVFGLFNNASIAQGASESEDISRGLATKSNDLRSLRCWDAAIVWKSWQFLVGGWLWIFVYSIGLPLFTVSTVLLISIILGEYASAEAYGIALMIVGGASFVILLARLFGNVLNREIYQQTLVSLCMLPRRRWVTIGELYLGLLPGLIAPLFCFALGVVWTGMSEPWFFENFFETLLEPWCWAVLGWLILTAHIGTLLSVYLRHGAMLIAVAVCWFLTPFVFGMVFGVIGLVFRGLGADLTEIVLRYMLPVAIIGGELTVCGLIHRWILFRFEELAAT